MSSDCSIVILKSLKQDCTGHEWRVAHLRSIHWEYLECQEKDGNVNELLPELRLAFKDSPVFSSEEGAFDAEDRLYDELEGSGMPEYGGTSLTLTIPF